MKASSPTGSVSPALPVLPVVAAFLLHVCSTVVLHRQPTAMAANSGSFIRVRLFFDYPPPSVVDCRMCWLLVDLNTCRVVSDLESLIRDKFGFSSRSIFNLFIDDCYLPHTESIFLVRDNDSVWWVCSLSVSAVCRGGKKKLRGSGEDIIHVLHVIVFAFKNKDVSILKKTKLLLLLSFCFISFPKTELKKNIKVLKLRTQRKVQSFFFLHVYSRCLFSLCQGEGGLSSSGKRPQQPPRHVQ